MALPNINFTIRDGALGLTTGSSDNVFVCIGPCSKYPTGLASGAAAIVLATPQDVVTNLGYGLLSEVCASILAVAGSTVYALPASQTSPGSKVTGVTTGVGNTSPKLLDVLSTTSGQTQPLDTYQVKVVVKQGGGNGTGTFAYSLDGGTTYSQQYVIPLSNTPTGTPVAGVAAVAPGGSVSSSGTSPAITITGGVTGSPAALDKMVIKVSTGGILSAAQVEVSNDGGNTYGAPVAISGGTVALSGDATGLTANFGAGTYVLNDTYTFASGSTFMVLEADNSTAANVLLSFPIGTYVAGDSYTFSTNGPIVTASDLHAQLLNNVIDNPNLTFSGIVAATNPPDINTTSGQSVQAIVTQLNTDLATLEGQYRYAFALALGGNVSSSTSGATPADYSAALLNDSFLRVLVAGGQEILVSSVTGRSYLTNTGLSLAARLALIPVQEHPGYVGRGSLANVSAASTGLSDATAFDLARVGTTRQFQGLPGFYWTKGVTLAPPGSDYQSIMNRRVMDKACNIAYATLLPFLNGQLVTNANGTITNAQANAIEQAIVSRFLTLLINPGNAVAASASVSRTANVLSTNTLPVTIRVQPYGYAQTISVDIGFQPVSG